MRGSSAQTISGTGTTDLGAGIVVMNPAGVTLSTNVNVSGGLVQTDGNYTWDSTGTAVNVTNPATGVLNTGSSTISLNPAGAMQEGNNPVQGNASATRVATTGSNQTFGSIGYEINAAGAAPGSTTVNRKTGVASTGNGNQSIKRYYDVTPTTNAGLNAAIAFYYADGAEDFDECRGNMGREIRSGAEYFVEQDHSVGREFVLAMDCGFFHSAVVHHAYDHDPEVPGSRRRHQYDGRSNREEVEIDALS